MRQETPIFEFTTNENLLNKKHPIQQKWEIGETYNFLVWYFGKTYPAKSGLWKHTILCALLRIFTKLSFTHKKDLEINQGL